MRRRDALKKGLRDSAVVIVLAGTVTIFGASTIITAPLWVPTMALLRAEEYIVRDAHRLRSVH